METVGSAFTTIWCSERGSRPSAEAITVAISLFNYERFLLPCLDSVLHQDYGDLELIVVDDKSYLDASVNTALRWMDRHSDRFGRAVLLQHEYNRGLAVTRNTAFGLARTEYVFVLDADNMLYPRALGRLIRPTEAWPYDAVYSQLELFGDQLGIGQADVWSRKRFVRGNYIDAMALIRKRSWQQVGGYDHIEGGWEDFDFWCKFIEGGMVGLFVPELLCRYRVHGKSMVREFTDRLTSQIRVEMIARHPWLNLPE